MVGLVASHRMTRWRVPCVTCCRVGGVFDPSPAPQSGGPMRRHELRYRVKWGGKEAMRMGLTEMQVVYLEEVIEQLKTTGFGTTPGARIPPLEPSLPHRRTLLTPCALLAPCCHPSAAACALHIKP